MAMIKLSKDAAIKAKNLTEDAFLDLQSNNKKLNDNIQRELQNLRDIPTTKKYAEMMMQIQSLTKQLRDNFNDINDYCDKIIKWIDDYNER